MEFPLGLSEIYSPRYFTTMCNTCLIRLNFFTYDNAKDVFSKSQTKNFYQKKFLHVLIFFFLGLKTRILNTLCVPFGRISNWLQSAGSDSENQEINSTTRLILALYWKNLRKRQIIWNVTWDSKTVENRDTI